MVKSAHSMLAKHNPPGRRGHRGIIESSSALDHRILDADRSAKAQSQDNTGGAILLLGRQDIGLATFNLDKAGAWDVKEIIA